MRRDPVRADGSRPGPLDALRAAARSDGPTIEQRPYALSLMRAVELGETKAAKRGHAIRAARLAKGEPAFLPKRSDRRREYRKAYHEAHREDDLARMRRYYAENRQRWRDRRNTSGPSPANEAGVLRRSRRKVTGAGDGTAPFSWDGGDE